MPIFALANAGVQLGGGIGDALTSPVALGIVAGLVVGKQLGITLFAWLPVRAAVSELPRGVGWRHVYGADGWRGSVHDEPVHLRPGFSDGSLVEAAKLGILVASLIAGAVGWTILRGASSPH
jgi:NhaA family Na+:H+ antiporter